MSFQHLLNRVARLERSYSATANAKAKARFEELWLAWNYTPEELAELHELGERLEPNWHELKDWLTEPPFYRPQALEKWRKEPLDVERKKRWQRFDQMRTEDPSLDDPEYGALAQEFGDHSYLRRRREREKDRERMRTYGFAYYSVENEDAKPEEQTHRANYFDADHQPVQMKMIVTKVEDETDAAAWEVKPGDEIVSVDGEPMTSTWQFRRAVRARSATKLHTIILRRGSELMEIDVSCGPFGAWLKMVPEGIPWETYPAWTGDDDRESKRVYGHTRWFPRPLTADNGPGINPKTGKPRPAITRVP